MNQRLLSILVLLGTLATIAINALANILPINGLNTGEISDRYPVLFTPAGYVFSIWGVIYIALIGFSIFQLQAKQINNPLLKATRIPYLLSCLLNSLWIFAWHNLQMAIAWLLIVGVFLSLARIYWQIHQQSGSFSNAERWLVVIPFSIYFGWLTVATVANTTILLYDLQWNGFGIAAAIWCVLILFVATSIALYTAFPRRDTVYLGVLVWAFAGIAVQQAGKTPMVVYTAAVLAIIIAVFAVWLRVGKRAN
jgi:hypothetical protein